MLQNVQGSADSSLSPLISLGCLCFNVVAMVFKLDSRRRGSKVRMNS